MLQQRFESEKRDLLSERDMLERRLESEKDEFLSEISSLRGQLQGATSSLRRTSMQDGEMQKQLEAVSAQRDQLQADVGHLKNVGDERQQSITSLRRSLEEE